MGKAGRKSLMVRRIALWGPLSAVGISLATLVYVADQAHKWYMLDVFGIKAMQPVNVFPGFDLVMVWNYGISYGWFASHSDMTRWILVGLKLVVSVLLVLWLARQSKAWVAAAIGLILGGALANATDRIAHGAVADFFHFYVGSFSWYVFNIADVAIVAGVLVLIFDSLARPAKEGDGRTNHG